MEHTEGLGRRADVWLGGDLLTVCDAVSSAARPCPPGVLEDVRFTYISEEGFTWEAAIGGNPSRHVRLEPVRGWAYVGYGKIVSIMPVVIDFGLLRMEDATWSTDERLVGRHVRIPIDRLELHNAAEDDWPEELR